ncbi:HAD family hydrolase [Gelatiniphilus marinus]|jgi:hypothetical protein|uniref:HAD family hydrolase n=1 Tax=Gelatiniphilus marinus TaxID=1759464 RepID=A0ABW5JXP1_9FLAO
MDFSGVKLVVSDMDGTLLNNKNEVSKRFLNQFIELKKRNIHFVAASGRQYHSILYKLNSIKSEISIIAENGGVLQHNNQTQVLLKLSNQDILKSVKLLREIEGSYIVLCGMKSAYIETNDSKFISKLKIYYTSYEIVEDLTMVQNDQFLKISVYHFNSSETNLLPRVNDLKDKLKVTVPGKNWLDITHNKSNKGYALRLIQKELNISKNETMVFGDYNNDLEMLELCYFSFAMENAHPDVKKIARFETKSNDDEGVENILEKLLKE